MLSFLRRGGFIQFVMAAIVMVIIAAFAFDYRGGETSLEQECVVQVAGDCVPPKDFFSAFRLAVPPQLEPEQIKSQGIRQQVIDGLVERELLLREARRLGVGVSEGELDKELALGRVHYSMPVARYTLAMSRRFELEPNDMVTYIPVKNPKTQEFDFKIYKRSVLNFARMSTKDFKERQSAELLAARMRSTIGSQVRVSESEAFAQFNREGSKAIARIAHVPREWFQRFTVFPSKEQEAAYAASNTPAIDDAWESEKAPYSAGCSDISEIVIDVVGLSNEEQTTAKAKLEDLRKGAPSAEDFALAARSLGTTQTAPHGGRVGCFSAEGDPDAQQAQEAVAGLGTGQLSEVLSNGTTLRLLRLNARLTETDTHPVGRQVAQARLTSESLAATQAEQFAKDVLAKTKAGTTLEQAIQTTSEELLATVPARHRKSISKAALEVDSRPKMEVSSSFNIAGNPVPTALGASPAAALFGLQNVDEVLPEPVATEQGWAVLQLKEKTAATREEFEEKKAQIVKELRLRKQADALVSYVKRLRDALSAEIQIDARFLSEASDATEDG